MTYKALKAKATPGTLLISDAGVSQSHDADRTLFVRTPKHGNPLYIARVCGEGVLAAASDERRANAALLVHCFNNFDDLLRIATHYVERMKCEHPVSQWEDEGIEIAEEILVRCREVKT